MNRKHSFLPLILILGTLLMPMGNVQGRSSVRRRKLKRKQAQQAKQQPETLLHKNSLVQMIDAVESVDKTQQNKEIEKKEDLSATSFLQEKQIDDSALPKELQTTSKKIKKELPQFPVDEETIEFHFQDTDLKNFITQIEEIFDINFIGADNLEPAPKDSKPILGNKISFKTHRPLTKKQAWGLFITFLDIAGLNVIPQPDPRIYRIEKFDATIRAAVPTFIGVDASTLPETQEVVRYVYFIENSTVDAIVDVVNTLKGKGTELIGLREHKGFILTDKAYNIKMLMKIVKELDQVSMPQAMSVLKLKRADAQQVKELYDSLIQTEQGGLTSRLFNARKQPTSVYFPENTRIIAETRTNALILLGSPDAIKKIEEFIIKNVDIELDKPYQKLKPYKLRYADANTIAEIMNSITQFGSSTAAGKSGGVRGGNKYIKPMSFHAEKDTNQIIIQGDHEDYLQAIKIIEELDEPQPQVALEVLVLSVNVGDTKELGVQLRTKNDGRTEGALGNQVRFQTSGMFLGASSPTSVIENTNESLGVNRLMGNIENTNESLGVNRLMGNLANLVKNVGPGNTIVTFGQDMFGLWGIFQVLQTIANTQVLSNPFTIVTNKSTATIELGETRRIVTGTTVTAGISEDSRQDDTAALKIEITPQINSDGMIVLSVIIENTEFTNSASSGALAGDKNTKRIVTNTIVADKEVLALGGVIRNRIEHSLNKVPLLGDIPVLGWLFKNKKKRQQKENLLILISTRIIEPEAKQEVDEFTQERVADYEEILRQTRDISERHDPIYQRFFAEKQGGTEDAIDNFIFKRSANVPESEKELFESSKNERLPDVQSERQVKGYTSKKQLRKSDVKKDYKNIKTMDQQEKIKQKKPINKLSKKAKLTKRKLKQRKKKQSLTDLLTDEATEVSA